MNIIKFSRRTKISIIIIGDFLVGFLAWIIIGPPVSSYLLDGQVSTLVLSIKDNFLGFFVPILMSIIFFHLSEMYRSMSRFYDPVKHLTSNFIGSLIFGLSWSGIYLYKVEQYAIDISVIIILQGLVLSLVFFSLTSAIRLVAKIILNPYKINIDYKPVIIYGAGSSGIELMYLLQADPSTKVIAFFDDKKDLHGTKIDGIQVFSKISKLSKIILLYEKVEVLLAIPSIGFEGRNKIIEKLQPLKVSVRSMPSIHQLVGDQKRMDDIQDLSLDDLLPKDRVSSIKTVNLENKNIMVTGAGGSIGSEIVRQILNSNPKKVFLVDFSEYSLFTIYEEALVLAEALNLNLKIIPILHDVSNEESFEQFFIKYSIDHIYHTAAYKHVPMLEARENILTGIKNNIFGTHAVCKLANKYNVEKVIMVSTDKAVRPTNLMGATKRYAEQVAQYFDALSATTIFSMVRFGNVMNSSGSVIPTFLKQIKHGGPVTITDIEVTRFFMTIPEASNLVMQAGAMSEGGEVFILDMGDQIKIIDLAKRLINLKGYNYTFDEKTPGIRIIETGLRAGEKLYEELLISGQETPTNNPKIFKSLEPKPSDNFANEIQELKIHLENLDIEKCISVLTNNVHGFNRKKNA